MLVLFHNRSAYLCLVLCVVYSSIQKFKIITIIKTIIFITLKFIVSILPYYLDYLTALEHVHNYTDNYSRTPII